MKITKNDLKKIILEELSAVREGYDFEFSQPEKELPGKTIEAVEFSEEHGLAIKFDGEWCNIAYLSDDRYSFSKHAIKNQNALVVGSNITSFSRDYQKDLPDEGDFKVAKVKVKIATTEGTVTLLGEVKYEWDHPYLFVSKEGSDGPDWMEKPVTKKVSKKK